VLVSEQRVRGIASRTKPEAVGKLDGAPVLGYVFPTTLKSQDVAFSATEGIVVLVVTSHPGFDDSPFWDENNDGRYDNDGLVYQTHWVESVEEVSRIFAKLESCTWRSFLCPVAFNRSSRTSKSQLVPSIPRAAGVEAFPA
jgi:hypothetical protein